jgi:hypothetical protein
MLDRNSLPPTFKSSFGRILWLSAFLPIAIGYSITVLILDLVQLTTKPHVFVSAKRHLDYLSDR